MPTKTDNGIKSVPPTVSNPDTPPARVEASPSSALRGTAEAQDGNKPATHTPTPWLMESGLGAAVVYALEEYRGKQRNRLFCQVQGGPDTPREEVIANAEFIVRAVNAHEALVHALTFAQLILEERIASDCDFCGGQGGSEGDGRDFRLTPVRHKAGCEYLTVAAALALAEGSRP